MALVSFNYREFVAHYQDTNDDGYIRLLYLIIMIIVTVEEIRTKGNSKQTKSHIGLHRKIYEKGEEKDIPI